MTDEHGSVTRGVLNLIPDDPQPQLNRLHAQVKQLKQVTTILGGLVAALVAANIMQQVRTPKELVISKNGSTLKLQPDQIAIDSGHGDKATLSTRGLLVSGSKGNSTKLDGTALFLSNDKSTVMLRGDGGSAMLSLGTGETVVMATAMGTTARWQLSVPGGRSISASVSPTEAVLNGLSPAAPDPTK